MSEQRKAVVTTEKVGVLAQFIRTLQLVWRLLNDARVPTLPKLVIPGTLIYVVSPVDIVPDFFLGLGQLDDVAIFALGIALFIELCPRKLVEEHRKRLAIEAGGVKPPEENVVEGTFHEVDEDDARSDR
jgi:uncharacterized membrane protein YkvA (DUF1232 family)